MIAARLADPPLSPTGDEGRSWLRRELLHAAMERERRQLAAEVHDGLAQYLALARRELAAEFPSEWTAETLPSAPGGVSALARRYGELRPGQLMLSRDAAAGASRFSTLTMLGT